VPLFTSSSQASTSTPEPSRHAFHPPLAKLHQAVGVCSRSELGFRASDPLINQEAALSRFTQSIHCRPLQAPTEISGVWRSAAISTCLPLSYHDLVELELEAINHRQTPLRIFRILLPFPCEKKRLARLPSCLERLRSCMLIFFFARRCFAIAYDLDVLVSHQAMRILLNLSGAVSCVSPIVIFSRSRVRHF
jgi:hypothetical protein